MRWTVLLFMVALVPAAQAKDQYRTLIYSQVAQQAIVLVNTDKGTEYFARYFVPRESAKWTDEERENNLGNPEFPVDRTREILLLNANDFQRFDVAFTRALKEEIELKIAPQYKESIRVLEFLPLSLGTIAGGAMISAWKHRPLNLKGIFMTKIAGGVFAFSALCELLAEGYLEFSPPVDEVSLEQAWNKAAQSTGDPIKDKVLRKIGSDPTTLVYVIFAALSQAAASYDVI